MDKKHYQVSVVESFCYLVDIYADSKEDAEKQALEILAKCKLDKFNDVENIVEVNAQQLND